MGAPSPSVSSIGRTVKGPEPAGNVKRACQRCEKSFAGCDWKVKMIVFPSGVFIGKKKSSASAEGFIEWLPRRDSNPNKQNQNLRCYHYTTRQSRVLPVLAGSTGLEPATPGSTVQCANQLRHNPVFQKVMIVYHTYGSRARGYFKKNAHRDKYAKRPVANAAGLLGIQEEKLTCGSSPQPQRPRRQ